LTDKVRIGSCLVGPGEATFVIAEVGSNHNRKWEQAKELIDVAAASRADAVKFQIYEAADLYPPESPVYEAVKATELPLEWIPRLAGYADKCGLLFFASVFGARGADALAEIGPPAYKIASSETVNLPLLKHVAAKGKPLLVSTGMCDLADIHEAIETIRSEGNSDVILLQCASLYPTEPRHAHLRAMDTLRAAFQLPVGFSDHTTDIVVSIAAVARGACVIEKHVTMSRALPGPDHGYALEPDEFRRMVQAIRATEEALGSAVKTMLPEEALYARRESIRAARGIAAGETLTEEVLRFERPGEGIRPRLLKAVVGRKAAEAIAAGEAITWAKLARRARVHHEAF